MAEGESGVGEHEKEVGTERPYNGGQNSIKIAGGQQGDEHHRQHEDQGGVVLAAGVGDEDAAGQVGRTEKERGDQNVPGKRRNAVHLAIDPLLNRGKTLGE